MLQPPIVFAITVILFCNYILKMYLVSQRSIGAPLDRQHTTQEMAFHTKFIVKYSNIMS